jgi:hypothetical protein
MHANNMATMRLTFLSFSNFQEIFELCMRAALANQERLQRLQYKDRRRSAL